MPSCRPCTLEYSRGDGTGVHEAIGNWGFSNEVASPGHELERMVCLLERMEALKSQPKCDACPAKKARRPQRCLPDPCPLACLEPREKPKLMPLITYNSVDETLLTYDQRTIRADRLFPLYGRQFAHQGTSKWYKLGPLCCPQPSCPAPSCPTVRQLYCRQNCCL